VSIRECDTVSTSFAIVLQEGAHLYTQGKEQREPVQVDHPTQVEDTKSEKFTEYEQLIVQVAEICAPAPRRYRVADEGSRTTALRLN